MRRIAAVALAAVAALTITLAPGAHHHATHSPRLWLTGPPPRPASHHHHRHRHRLGHVGHLAYQLSACASTDCGPYAITLNWGTFAGLSFSPTGYNVLLGGQQIGTTTGTSFAFTGMDCATTFTLGVQAKDNSSHTSQVYTTSYTSPSCTLSGGSSSSSVLPYASTSPWNTTIASAGATTDPSSSTMISRLSSLGKPLTSTTSQNTPDLVTINSATQTTQPVLISNAIYGYGGGSWHIYNTGDATSLGGAQTVGHSPPAGLVNVPIPTSAVDPGPFVGPGSCDTACTSYPDLTHGPGTGTYSDNQLITWDPSSGFELDCWLWDPGTVFSGWVTPAGANATGPANGLTSTSGANCSNAWEYFTKPQTTAGTTYQYYGLMADGAAGRGGGTPYLAGLVRPWEIQQGHIDHAIAWAYTSPTSGHVYPAYKSDGSGTATGDLPEGSRLQLDPTLTDPQITALGCTGACLTIAHALQTYGAFEIDNSGSTKLYLEADSTASPSWSSLGISSTASLPSPLTPGNSFSHFLIVDTPQGPV